MKRLRPNVLGMLALTALVLGVYIPFLRDSRSFGDWFCRYLPSALKPRRFGVLGESADYTLVYLGFPLLVLTVRGMLLLRRPRLTATLLVDLRQVPGFRDLRWTVLHRSLFIVPAVLLIGFQCICGWMLAEFEGVPPVWIIGAPVMCPLIIVVDDLRLMGRLSNSWAIGIELLLWLCAWSAFVTFLLLFWPLLLFPFILLPAMLAKTDFSGISYALGRGNWRKAAILIKQSPLSHSPIRWLHDFLDFAASEFSGEDASHQSKGIKARREMSDTDPGGGA